MQTCQEAYRVKEARVFWNTAREFESPGDFVHLARLGRSHPGTRVDDLHHDLQSEKETRGKNLTRCIFEITRFPAVTEWLRMRYTFFSTKVRTIVYFVDHYRCSTRCEYFSRIFETRRNSADNLCIAINRRSTAMISRMCKSGYVARFIKC